MKLLKVMSMTLLCISLLSACTKQKDSQEITIGIIEPLEHKAMDEIVAGFTETLKKEYSKPVTIKVENAQNDANLKRAIIQKMRDENYTIIAPIGVDATQMTLAMTKNQNVISLASDLSEIDRKNLHPCHVGVVHDEISSDQLISFIHTVYPNIKHITLIHSSADKVFPEVEETIKIGKKYGIDIDHMMVSSLPELTSSVQSLPSQTQGILVLKDSLIVSGIATLQQAATKLHIPLITSDQGSVQDGAGFALGVHEREIGVEGAKLTAAVLKGKSICDLPIVEMKNLTVFINQNSLKQEGQNLNNVEVAAKKLNYQIEMVN